MKSIWPRPICQSAIPALVACATGLGACSAHVDADPLATGTVVTPPPPVAAAPAPVSDQNSDWDAVRRAMAKVVPKDKAAQVPWTNKDTGNSGTITDVIASSNAGKPCRNFSATLSSIDGIRLYKAEMCRERTGTWEYTRLEPFEEAVGGAPRG